jgi:ABC-2 type transport system ATP-binding protein
VSEPLVRIEAVTKRFGPEAPPAVAGLSATIEAGRVTGLVGPDGAGKTTLLRLIDGLLLPDAGRLAVCGFDSATQPGEIRRVVAYMPQRFGLYEDLTVLENLTLYADLRSVVGRERREAFDHLLAFTDLARFAGRLAGALSGGMKQKLGLACALVRQPRLLLLDEPSVGVDPISRRELWRMVDALVDQGIGVVWSTAYLDEAERCAETLLLSEGRLLHRGPPADLIRRAAGRSFAVRDLTADRRAVLARALGRAEVIDGVVQGRDVRLVLAEAPNRPCRKRSRPARTPGSSRFRRASRMPS